jgi:hypothetical protein
VSERRNAILIIEEASPNLFSKNSFEEIFRHFVNPANYASSSYGAGYAKRSLLNAGGPILATLNAAHQKYDEEEA